MSQTASLRRRGAWRPGLASFAEASAVREAGVDSVVSARTHDPGLKAGVDSAVSAWTHDPGLKAGVDSVVSGWTHDPGLKVSVQ